MANKFIVVRLEVRDGEREYMINLLCCVHDNETPSKCAERNARHFYEGGKKIDKNRFEQCNGEVITELNGYEKVDEKEVEILVKYLATVF